MDQHAHVCIQTHAHAICHNSIALMSRLIWFLYIYEGKSNKKIYDILATFITILICKIHFEKLYSHNGQCTDINENLVKYNLKLLSDAQLKTHHVSVGAT